LQVKTHLGKKYYYINTAVYFHKTRLQGFAVVKSDLHSLGTTVEPRL